MVKQRSVIISNTKTAALARVLDLVPKGYPHFVAGRIPPEKLIRLLGKFQDRYQIAATPAERLTRKSKRLANTQLVLFWPMPAISSSAADEAPGVTGSWLARVPEGAVVAPPVEWLLLVSEGTGPVVEQEPLRSVLEKPRLAWLGYELVRHTARGKAVWTWRRPTEAMAELYAQVGDQLARHHVSAVTEVLLRISRQPGFAGVRKQAHALFAFARQRGYREELPFLFHVQKVPAGLRLPFEAAG